MSIRTSAAAPPSPATNLLPTAPKQRPGSSLFREILSDARPKRSAEPKPEPKAKAAKSKLTASKKSSADRIESTRRDLKARPDRTDDRSVEDTPRTEQKAAARDSRDQAGAAEPTDAIESGTASIETSSDETPDVSPSAEETVIDEAGEEPIAPDDETTDITEHASDPRIPLQPDAALAALLAASAPQQTAVEAPAADADEVEVETGSINESASIRPEQLDAVPAASDPLTDPQTSLATGGGIELSPEFEATTTDQTITLPNKASPRDNEAPSDSSEHENPSQNAESEPSATPEQETILPLSIETTEIARAADSGGKAHSSAVATHSATPDVALNAAPAPTAGKTDSSIASPPPLPLESRFAEANHPRVVDVVRSELLPKGGSVELRLDPPELGALQVKIDVRDGVVTASFQTSNDEATRLLSHTLEQLRQSLETRGVTVDKLQVQQLPRNESNSNNPSDQQQSQDHRGSHQQQQEQQRRELLEKMWRRLAIGRDAFDAVA